MSALKALFDKKVILIDVNTISQHDYPSSPNHQRKTCDFFNFKSTKKINTLFISHTLQFIDDDLERLNNKIGNHRKFLN